VQAEIKKTEQQNNNWAQNKVWPKSFLQTGPDLGRIRPNRIIRQPSWGVWGETWGHAREGLMANRALPHVLFYLLLHKITRTGMGMEKKLSPSPANAFTISVH
jgi:hypothetical protein